MTALIAAGAIAVVLVLLAALLLKIRRIAEPDEALIISGLKRGDHGFKIITGGGCFVWPFLEQARTLELNLREADLTVACVTKQGIPVVVKGVAIYKVADDEASISNAARRFLGQQNNMDNQVHNVFAGHMRAIIGGLTVEEMIGNRERLESETRDSSAKEMETLGLLLDSLKIQEIDDPTDYIKHLAAPHQAEVEKNARVAQAGANQTAAEAEAEATANISAAQRDASIKQASYQADVQKAQAQAAQAGPLAAAEAQKAVTEQQTAVAELEAKRKERELDATVRKPAEAQRDADIAQAEAERQTAILHAQADAEQVRLNAQADAEATKLNAEANASKIQQTGEAEAAATRAKGEAEGIALKARADGLAANNEAVISQQLAGQAVDIVKAATGIFDNVDSVTVLNGANGLMESLSTVIAQALNTYHTVQNSIGHKPEENGHADFTHEAIGVGPTR